MKRWSHRITVCLILGAVTTVGVAWGCTLLMWRVVEEWPRIDLAHEEPHIRWWQANAPESWRDTPGRVVTARFVGLTRAVYAELSQEESYDSPTFRWLQRRTAGWPLHALDGRVQETGPYDQSANSTWEQSGLIALDLSWLGIPPDLAPIRPLPVGFLINTLFYAAIWFGLFFATGMTRRFIRTRRGRCPRCGYDLRGEFEDGCSECGWGRGE